MLDWHQLCGWALVNVAGACLGAGLMAQLTHVLQALAARHPNFPVWWVPETVTGFAAALALAVLGWTLLESA